MHELTQANAKVSATYCGPLGVQGTWDYQIENLADFHRMCHEMWIDSKLDPTEILVPVDVALEITRDVLMSTSSIYMFPHVNGGFGGTGLGIDYLINRVTGSSVYLNHPGKLRPEPLWMPDGWVSLIVDEYED